MPRNIIVLTVDTLRADRLSLYGYDRPTSPCLERLAADAVVCDNAFTMGPFTHNACVQIFTSSRPFSHGGYDHGARGRPETLFQAFRNAGYSTTGMSTAHWVSRFYGYEGLENELQLFTLNTLVGMSVSTMRDSLRLWHEGEISPEQALEQARPSVEWLFENVGAYCRDQIARCDEIRTHFPHTQISDSGYDFNRVIAVTEHHRQAFADDPGRYMATRLSRIPASHEWLAAEWRFCRTPAKLLREAATRGAANLISFTSPRLARQIRCRTRYYPDARSLGERILRAVRERDSSRPFLAWAHFKDTHQPYVSGYGPDWYRETPDRLRALGHDPALDPTMSFSTQPPETEAEFAMFSALYDASIHSTDQAIGMIADGVDAMGLGEDTVIAVCADHGEEFGEHGDAYHSCLFYEHNMHVPMLFRRKGQEAQRIGDLTMLLDFAPTIAAMAGIEPVSAWEGRSVTDASAAPRDHVMMEAFCRGNCLFDHRPLYLGVRTDRHKYIWKEYRDPHDRHGADGHELYDLTQDPAEKNNLYHEVHPALSQLDPLIIARLREIPEFPEERLRRRFNLAA